MTVQTVQISWVGSQNAEMLAVMPGELDIANADLVREALLRALNSSVRTLVIDMSRTTFCDVSGVRLLEDVQVRARARGTQLRLVVTAPIVRRMFVLNGLHRTVAIYPSLAAARPGPRGIRRGPVVGARDRRRARFREN